MFTRIWNKIMNGIVGDDCEHGNRPPDCLRCIFLHRRIQEVTAEVEQLTEAAKQHIARNHQDPSPEQQYHDRMNQHTSEPH